MVSSRYDPRQDNKKYSTPVKVVGGGGKKVKLYDIGTVDANGQYPIPSGYDGYKGFNVAVPTPEKNTHPMQIDSNGFYDARSFGWDGFSYVEVNCSGYTHIVANAELIVGPIEIASYEGNEAPIPPSETYRVNSEIEINYNIPIITSANIYRR